MKVAFGSTKMRQEDEVERIWMHQTVCWHIFWYVTNAGTDNMPCILIHNFEQKCEN